MKLFRFGEKSKEKPGVLIDGRQYDASAFGEDYGEAFFESDGLARLETWLSENKNLPLVKEGTRLGPCFQRP